MSQMASRPRSQNAARFGEELRLVGDVHLRVLAPDDVERAVGEREVQCVGVHDVDAFGEPSRVVQPFGGGAKVGAQIDGRHGAAVVMREQSTRSADSRPHVEHAVLAADHGEVGEVYRR
jgi:hypothetical protein